MKNPEIHLIVSRFRGIADLGWSKEGDIEGVLFQQMSDNISRIMDSLPAQALLIAFSGPGHVQKGDRDTLTKRSGFGFFMIK